MIVKHLLTVISEMDKQPFSRIRLLLYSDDAGPVMTVYELVGFPSFMMILGLG